MRKLRHLLVLMLAVPLVAGCGDLLDLDINTNPNTATAVEPDLLLPTIQARVASQRSIEIGPGQAFFSQIWASNGSAGVFLDPERYIISSFTTGNTWDILYTDGLKNLALMRDQALEGDNPRPNVAAQAEILSAYIFWMLTSMWEDIPYTEALNGAEFPQPHFDDQETVLRGIVDQLDAAVALIDRSAGAAPGVTGGDLMYGGNMDLWERFANSLKLRTLMMIRNQDTSVDAEIAETLNDPLIRENSQEAAFPFYSTTGNENNVWKLNNLFGGFTNAMNGNGFLFAGETLVDIMKDVGDPRLDTYFEHAVEDFNIAPDGGGAATTEHFGQTAGVADYNDAETSMISQNIIRRDWPNRAVTAAEVWLLEAEYLALTGDLPGAHASYIEGVERGLDYFDGKPGEISEAEEDTYIASLPGSFANPTTALEAIWTQQYIEVWDRAPENWVQVRRTGFPDLPLPNQAALGDLIRRYPYPPDELSANPNAPSQVSLDVPMWFEN